MIHQAFRNFIKTRNFAQKHERALFDSRFYLSTYCDVRAAEVDAFQHYMEHGWREGRDPSDFFKTLYYRDMHLSEQPENPLTHYVRLPPLRNKKKILFRSDRGFIAMQANLVSSLFDYDFYRMQVGERIDDLLEHYLTCGWKLNLSPNREFDVIRYTQNNAYIYSIGVSPLYHYASQARLNKLMNAGAECL